MECFEVIVRTIRDILEERGEGGPPPALEENTRILATGLDSLDVAALVARLEERLGFDPFADESIQQYPQTLGQLAELYEQVRERKK